VEHGIETGALQKKFHGSAFLKGCLRKNSRLRPGSPILRRPRSTAEFYKRPILNFKTWPPREATAMSLSVHRRLGDAGGGKGGSIVARGAAAHRHHAPAAASASASSSYSSSLEGADPALPSPSWQPLPRSLPKRRRDGTNNSAYDASGPAPRTRRTTARMTWPPERTPRRGGAALSSPQPRGLTREEEYLGWLGSLRSRPQPRGASASAPPSPTASSAARVPPPRHSGGINASSSSTDISPAALPSTRKGRPQASATSPVGSAPSPLSALATASLGAHRPPPMTKQLTGTRSASLRPKAKLPTRADSALPPLQTTKPTPDPPSMQTDLAPPPPFLAAFAHRIVEVLCLLIYLLIVGSNHAPR
jgi:hypothetical protein